MSVNLGDNYLDSRNIQDRIDELESMTVEEMNEDSDLQKELEIWNELKKETEEYGWVDGIFFFHEDEDENYAQQFAEDIGAIPSDAPWPVYCIDWEHATREFLMDYTTVDIDGQTYYYREA